MIKIIPLTINELNCNIKPNLLKNYTKASTQLFYGMPWLMFEKK